MYTSSELEEREKASYEKHLNECDYCRGQLQRYTEERETLFGSDILGEETSKELDSKVRDLWPPPTVPATSFFPFAMILKRSALAMFFLALGLGGGVYVAYNLGQGGRPESTAARNHGSSVQNPTVAAQTPSDPIHAARDSLTGSELADSGAQGPVKARTPISSEGVIPVDQQR